MLLEEAAIYVGGRSCHRYSQKYPFLEISLKLVTRIKPSTSHEGQGYTATTPPPPTRAGTVFPGMGIWAGDQTVNYAYPFILQTDRDFFKFLELLLQNLCLTISKCAQMCTKFISINRKWNWNKDGLFVLTAGISDFMAARVSPVPFTWKR